MKRMGLVGLLVATLVCGPAYAETVLSQGEDAVVEDGALRVQSTDQTTVFRMLPNGMRFVRDSTIYFDIWKAGSRLQVRTSTSDGARDITPIILENNGNVTVPMGDVHLGSASARIGVGTTVPQETVDVRGTTMTEDLVITQGSDLSETFEIDPGRGELRPGMVVSIDPETPGALRISNEPYDKKVAGIVSGAGRLKPGMVMGQKGTIADGKHPVALTGRVYCYVDASHGAVEPGDMLTTSSTPGHAMKVTDQSRAHGAILGKAMTALESGRGLVLVLVTLH